MDQRNVNGQRASGSRGSSSFLEFSSTSIHYWTTKSLNSLNRLTKGKKKSKNQTHPDPAIGQSSVGSSATTVFGVDAATAPQTTKFDERKEYYSYIREERYPRRQSDSTSVHYATLGRAGRHKISAPSAHPYATHASGTNMYHRHPRTSTSSMDRREYRDFESVSKSESRLHVVDDNANSLPSSSAPPRHTRLPGDPITTYEERYESSIEVDRWVETQSIETRKLDRHDRMIMKIKDERDTIQKKTFTKWVNKHLSKSGKKIDDLFVGLQDGFNLITLLEALSGETLPKENGFTRFHRIQNVQYVLDFLKAHNIRTVNIRPEDIVGGNPKLTLGLIWTIILNYQVSVIKLRQQQHALARAAALGHSAHSTNASGAVIEASSSSAFYSSTSGATKTTVSKSVVQFLALAVRIRILRFMGYVYDTRFLERSLFLSETRFMF